MLKVDHKLVCMPLEPLHFEQTHTLGSGIANADDTDALEEPNLVVGDGQVQDVDGARKGVGGIDPVDCRMNERA
jgi:hypothetical protein